MVIPSNRFGRLVSFRTGFPFFVAWRKPVHTPAARARVGPGQEPLHNITSPPASGADAGGTTAQVPSGASTGKSEAIELRDGDPKRHGGLGCRRAVDNVTGEIAGAICGAPFDSQDLLDRALIELDGTPSKSRLGANAVLGVSLSFARAAAIDRGVPFYKHLADALDHSLVTLPMMTINLFSGGKHAGGQVPIQDVLIVPVGAKTIDQGLVTASAVVQSAAEFIQEKYGMRQLTADEGGLAPPFSTVWDYRHYESTCLHLRGVFVPRRPRGYVLPERQA